VIIDYLAHHQALIPEVTDLLYAQWSDLLLASGTSKEKLAVLLGERAVTDRLPITLVALSDGMLAGTGSIKLSEDGTKAGLSPWLGGMYVKPHYRSSGVGTAIVRALEAKAAELGVKAMYLSAGEAQAFYQRLGWSVLERVTPYGIKEVALMTRALTLQAHAVDGAHSFKPPLASI
jgi:GNAT superfamily N-acetyltransferase